MGVCVTYILDPNMLLPFDLKVQFTWFLTFFTVCPVTFFNIGLPYLAHGSINMKDCVVYIHNPDTILTFDLKVKLTVLC